MGLVTAFDIKADVLVSLALIASVIIGEDFAAGKAKIVSLAARWVTWIVVMALTAAVLTWIVTGQPIRAVTIEEIKSMGVMPVLLLLSFTLHFY